MLQTRVEIEYKASINKEWLTDGDQKYMIIKNIHGTLDYKYILDKENKSSFTNLYVVYFGKVSNISRILMPTYFDFT